MKAFLKYLVPATIAAGSLLMRGEARAQDYPQAYFRSPLDIPLFLAGNFGECRPNHFHTGLDLKTDQRENLSVYAAADGEVSRIALSHTGYGNVLYVTHPNGYETVYAHLNDFAPGIMKYTRQQQYQWKKWNIDITIPKGMLPVKKGDIIAFSGNTGGSTSPHLHFEIRKSGTDLALNPALFGFNIKDSKAPVFKSIAIYDADRNIYEQDPLLIQLVKKGDRYTASRKIAALPFKRVKIGVHADDVMEGSYNILGIYRIQLLENGRERLSTRLNELSFSFNRYMNAYGDYKTFKKKGIWYQGLYRLPNNRLPVYSGDDGSIDLSAGEKQVQIKLIDASGNTAICDLVLQWNGRDTAYRQCGHPEWASGKIELPVLQFYFNPADMYDPFCVDVITYEGNKIGYAANINSPLFPLHGDADLKIKLKNPLPFELRNKLILIHKVRAERLPGETPQEGIAAGFENGWAAAKVRTLGYYAVGIDTTAPQVKFHFKNNEYFTAKKTIRFTVAEAATSIAVCNAYIDDKWICFSRRGNTFSYTFDEYCLPGTHTLRVEVSDESGNVARKVIAFKN